MAAPKKNKYWQLAKGFAVGKEKAYTPQQLWKKAVEFLQWLDENPLKEEKVFGTGFKTEVSKMKAPTLSGFCIYAGIHTSTFNRYINNEDEVYRNIAKHIQDLFFAIKFEGAAADLMNPNIIARETGLSEKQDVKIEDSRDSIDYSKLDTETLKKIKDAKVVSTNES